ncbi:MAG: NfeD-like protein [Thermosynechococcaceae cyanobacterium]
MLATIYWFCFLVGGIFVALAVIGGVDGVEFEFEADTDLDLSDKGEGARSPSDPPRFRSSKRSFTLFEVFTSFKFWTFGTCFFGLTGLVLSHLRVPLAAPVVVLIALAMGLLMGTAMSSILLSLRRRHADSLIRSEDLVGLNGTVEVPFDASSRGKVRLEVKGTSRDFVAMTDHPSLLDFGTSVMVVGTKNNQVWVVAEETLQQSSSA